MERITTAVQKIAFGVQQIAIGVQQISSDVQENKLDCKSVLEVLEKVDKRLKNVEVFQQRPSQPTVISSKNRMLLVLPK
jgi:methyl-accepting chemotaxis protein